MRAIKEKAKKEGYVDTLLGRRIYVPDLHSSNYAARARAERIAVNAPIQGTAADLIKLAMIQTDRWLQDQKMASRLIMQVHDELVLEVPKEELEIVTAKLPELFSHVMEFKVPLIAKVGVGRNWEEAH
jgi:DNA polymerase-1